MEGLIPIGDEGVSANTTTSSTANGSSFPPSVTITCDRITLLLQMLWYHSIPLLTWLDTSREVNDVEEANFLDCYQEKQTRYMYPPQPFKADFSFSSSNTTLPNHDTTSPMKKCISHASYPRV